MRAASVVILKICRQHTAQMTLIEDDDVIEAFAADRANDALDIGILPRRARRSDDLVDRHRLEAIAEDWTIRCVAIPQQMSGCCVPRERLDDLSGQPDLCRVLCDIEMDNFSSLVAEDDQGVEELKPRRYDNEHVDGGGVMHVIVQE